MTKNPLRIDVQNNIKRCRSPNYNYDFNLINGNFVRWGKTINTVDDPLFAPSAEILDIEVTTKCSGVGGKLCAFCYKANSPNGKNMSLDTFKTILSKFMTVNGHHMLTQMAFGADSKAEANPDLFKMMEHARSVGVIPNITVADVSQEVAVELGKHCGAVCVSRYENKNICYDSVQRLTSCWLPQVNIHQMISQETFDQALETLNDVKTDPRLSQLNALVFLSLKKKGRGTHHNPLTQEQFNTLVQKAQELGVKYGFDSCSAQKFINSLDKNDPKYELYMQCTEPCESFGIFSSYINVEGKYFPCSFCEGAHADFIEGIDVTTCNSFEADVWYSPLMNKWRVKTLKERSNGNYGCPIFEV